MGQWVLCVCVCALWVVLMRHSSLQRHSWMCFGYVRLSFSLGLNCELQMTSAA